MGMDCELKEKFSFKYKAEFDNGLTEHEIDHVLIGRCDAEPVVNPEEVGEYKWADMDELKKDILQNPDNYTPWFGIILESLEEHK